MSESPDIHEQLVDAASGIYGSHPRTRTLHAKGFYCSGSFAATPEAAALTRAAHMQGDPVPFITRFSIGGGKPDAHDSVRESRGMATKFRLADGTETDLLGVTAPVFIARTPEDFLEVLIARRPDPETGEPDMERIGAYLQDHPEALPSVQATLGTPPPASYAQLAYNSQHAFNLIDAAGEGHWVRYRIEPQAGETTITDEEAKERGPDYLRSEFSERLASGPASFDVILILAEDGDSLVDPTSPWPEDRRRVLAGTLEVEAIIDDPEAGGGIVVFDPTNVIDGIELPDDPILHARSGAYSVSAERRASPG